MYDGFGGAHLEKLYGVIDLEEHRAFAYILPGLEELLFPEPRFYLDS